MNFNDIDPDHACSDNKNEMKAILEKYERMLPPGVEEKFTTQGKIKRICDAIKDLIVNKNIKYGDSALSPSNIFYKGNSTNSILIRLDDKLNRVKNNKSEKPRINDIVDIIGYCILLLISLNADESDIKKIDE